MPEDSAPGFRTARRASTAMSSEGEAGRRPRTSSGRTASAPSPSTRSPRRPARTSAAAAVRP